MIHEEKKVAKIVEELTMFFFAVGAEQMESGIRCEDGRVRITFRSDFAPEHRDKVTGMEKYFQKPKNEGMEDIYWELAGSGDPGESSQLLLLGMMVNEAHIQINEGMAELVLYKNDSGF